MKTILSIFFISLISFASYAQEEWDPTDHQIATWQFRSISPSDVANFLSNEDNAVSYTHLTLPTNREV